jgi:hypothetical protein
LAMRFEFASKRRSQRLAQDLKLVKVVPHFLFK